MSTFGNGNTKPSIKQNFCSLINYYLPLLHVKDPNELKRERNNYYKSHIKKGKISERGHHEYVENNKIIEYSVS